MLIWLQILRGVSAILVVLFHFRGFVNNAYGQKDLGDLLFSSGYMGVDVLFLISGFIIVYSTNKASHARPMDFIVRRFFRVVPLAWLAIITFDWSENWHYDQALLWKSLLFIPAENSGPPWYGYSLLRVVWSLSYELIFYALFAGVLCFTRKYRTILASLAICALVMPYQLIRLGHLTVDAHAAPVPAFSSGIFPPQIWGLMTNPILYEFIIGMICAEIYLWYDKKDWRLNRFAGRFIAFCLFSIWLYCFIALTPGGHGLAGKGGSAVALFVACLLMQATSKGAPDPAPGIWFYLGTISYSLYLIHNGVVERILWKTPVVKEYYFKNPGFPMMFACVALSVALAALTYQLIERPLHEFGKRMGARFAKPPASPAAHAP